MKIFCFSALIWMLTFTPVEAGQKSRQLKELPKEAWGIEHECGRAGFYFIRHIKTGEVLKAKDVFYASGWTGYTGQLIKCQWDGEPMGDWLKTQYQKWFRVKDGVKIKRRN